MIHEIAPAELDNQYYDASPDSDSRICLIRNDSWFIKKEKNRLSWPVFEELKDPKTPLRYLFSISGKKYFLGEEKTEVNEIGAQWVSWRNVRDMTPGEEVFAGMTAMHLKRWYGSVQYCGACGGRTVHAEKERMMRCPSCGQVMFPKISPAVVVAVRDEKNRLLLTKYAGKVNDQYALVAGFIEIGETAEECVRRELLEETGVKARNIKYFGSQPWGFVGNLMLGFTAELEGSGEIVLDQQELSAAVWLAPDEIPEIEDYSSLTREMIRRFKHGKLVF